MWYKSVNKVQFRSYVRQDTRLNVAYWTATKVIQICELQANDLSLDQQITQMHSRVVSLLNAVKEEVSEDPTKVSKHHHIHKKDMFTEADKMIEMVTGSYHKSKKHESVEKSETLKKYDDLREADNKRI